MLTNKDIKNIAAETGLVEEQVLQGLRKYSFDLDKFYQKLPIYKSIHQWAD